MKTAVYQSYRTHNVPDWISLSMKIVEKWARSQGYDYIFFDDRMFDYAPDWYKQRAQNQILPISDLARLEIARELLSKGYERTIWIDADIILFDPDNFNITITDQFAFTKEIWVDKNRLGFVDFEQRVCNAVTVMTASNNILDFYIYACKNIANHPEHWIHRFMGSTKLGVRLERLKQGALRSSAKVASDIVGTEFLTQLYKAMSFQLIEHIGLFSPILLKELESDKHNHIKKYMQLFGNPLYGANLCGSAAGTGFSEVLVNRAIDKLLSTKGKLVNQYVLKG